MTISTNCAYNNQTHCNIKNLYFNKHKHKHMVNHICWNPSFFPLPNADIHEISNFYQKRHLFIKNYSFFIKNLIDPPYKKLQPQISPFIKNSIFGNNRDPWAPHLLPPLPPHCTCNTSQVIFSVVCYCLRHFFGILPFGKAVQMRHKLY